MSAFDLPINDPSLYALASYSNRAKNRRMAHPELSSTTMPPLATGSAGSSSANAAILNSSSAAASASALSSIGAAASPTDVLLTLPPPVLRLLVTSAPFIQSLTTIAQLLTWTHPNKFAPFLLPIAWTALCLGGEIASRYALNAVLLLCLGVGWIARKGTLSRLAGKKEGVTSLHTEPTTKTLALATMNQPAVQVLTPAALNTLLHQATILSKHVQVLNRTFSPLFAPFTWRDPTLSMATMNFLLTSYPFYLILTYFVSLRYIILLVGLTGLLWEAPWFAVIRRALWASLLVRRTVRFGVRLLQGDIRYASTEAKSGQKDIGILARLQTARVLSKADVALTASPVATTSSASADGTPRARSRSADKTSGVGKALASTQPQQSVEIQYLFTIYENQRWWIGLEWTQALLPNERPSWSDPTHAACTPPGSFQLPASTTVIVASEGVRKVYVWKWLDSEWRIRGTKGVSISPSTIGANANPPPPSSNAMSVMMSNANGSSSGTPGGSEKHGSAGQAGMEKVMGSLGEWKNMLTNKKDADAASLSSGRRDSDTSALSSSPHKRKDSTSLFADGLQSFIGGSKEIRSASATKAGLNAPDYDIAKARRRGSDSEETDLSQEDGDIHGHPQRMDDTEAIAAQELETQDWIVDAQGWQYADNHWYVALESSISALHVAHLVCPFCDVGRNRQRKAEWAATLADERGCGAPSSSRRSNLSTALLVLHPSRRQVAVVPRSPRQL